MSHSGDNMTDKSATEYRSVHVRLPSWLIERINSHAEAVGQVPSVEMRRALVEAFTERNGCQCTRAAEIVPEADK